MVATDVTADELTLAKDAITHALPGQFETNEFTVGALSAIFVYGLPLDYYSTLPGQINAVTAKDVQTVAAKYLVPEKMVVVAVGDSAKIREPLEKEIAPAELRNPGRPAAAEVDAGASMAPSSIVVGLTWDHGPWTLDHGPSPI